MSALQNITAKKPFLVAGGGIGGLAAGLALARQGARVDIIEQSKEFSEVGAGIQLGSNATRILFDWGLQDALEKRVVQPESIIITNGKNGRTLNRIPLTPLAEQMFGAPYYTIMRADLQFLLLEKLKEFDTVNLNNGFQIKSFESDGRSVRVISEDGFYNEGVGLVGADGVWSVIRSQMLPQLFPHYSGKTAWRALIDIESVPEKLRKSVVSLYMGPRCHLVHYPVKQGKKLNIVAVIDDPETPTRYWDRTGDKEQLLDAFSSWSTEIKEFLNSVPVWTKWALFEHQCPKYWVMENIALLGDAVHPTLPFMAQGAVMALEDAQCIANSLVQADGDVQQGFQNYQKKRVQRVGKVQKTSRKMGKIYHLRGPAALARNMVLMGRNSSSLLKDYEWLYGYKVA